MDWEECVAPTAGRQGLNLDMGEHIQLLANPGAHPAIEENGRVFLDLADGLGQPLRVLAGDEELVLAMIFVTREIQTVPLHAVVAPGTVATGIWAIAHVEEQPLDVVPFQHLDSLRFQFVHIGRVVQAVVVPAGGKIFAPFPIFVVLEMANPLRVRLRVVFIHPHANIGWSDDIPLAAGFNLLTEQIEF